MNQCVFKQNKMKKINAMKKLLLLLFLPLFLCLGCEKEEFDLLNPTVDMFVKKLKDGTYDFFEEQMLIMPNFDERHIQKLIDLSRDTIRIPVFPVNPISSGTPFPEGRDYFILGECLLWTVEGIRNEMKYGSLSPFLIDLSLDEIESAKGLTNKQILQVRELYIDWWSRLKDKDWKASNPLDGTTIRWK
jgi:hypothetical protein